MDWAHQAFISWFLAMHQESLNHHSHGCHANIRTRYIRLTISVVIYHRCFFHSSPVENPTKQDEQTNSPSQGLVSWNAAPGLEEKSLSTTNENHHQALWLRAESTFSHSWIRSSTRAIFLASTECYGQRFPASSIQYTSKPPRVCLGVTG